MERALADATPQELSLGRATLFLLGSGASATNKSRRKTKECCRNVKRGAEDTHEAPSMSGRGILETNVSEFIGCKQREHICGDKP